MKDVLAELSPRDLESWRWVCGQKVASEDNPGGFSREESISAQVEYWRMAGSLFLKYDVYTGDADPLISPITGEIYVTET